MSKNNYSKEFKEFKKEQRKCSNFKLTKEEEEKFRAEVKALTGVELEPSEFDDK